jgi:hypothetical protein
MKQLGERIRRVLGSLHAFVDAERFVVGSTKQSIHGNDGNVWSPPNQHISWATHVTMQAEPFFVSSFNQGDDHAGSMHCELWT